ncbi:dihydrodipicolinate synthase family protein [Microbacterium amylolyticum]|uniref:Dihydrodipicolinate synthase/N-acetylneuraminate lyase n=1 Tax=Microbacterium amylolyticum TaxID=936337 RepID=A0ABS4ZK17_9MICO|nr:dihydrodipicolinate synthase family protein [Microbacterium amylolyticum]MBP2437632.1 dihydrodipicolinate synthase/N-acetylneuraminate lyase [Microbacterium amylolyticum]
MTTLNIPDRVLFFPVTAFDAHDRVDEDLVGAPQEGLIAYVEQIAAATDLPLVVYHRANAQFTPSSIARLLQNPQIAGVKDGAPLIDPSPEQINRLAAIIAHGEELAG